MLPPNLYCIAVMQETVGKKLATMQHSCKARQDRCAIRQWVYFDCFRSAVTPTD